MKNKAPKIKQRTLRRLLYALLRTIKSMEFLAAITSLIFMAWLTYCIFYPRVWADYGDDIIDKAFAPLRWTFIWIMGVGVWGFIIGMITIARD